MRWKWAQEHLCEIVGNSFNRMSQSWKTPEVVEAPRQQLNAETMPARPSDKQPPEINLPGTGVETMPDETPRPTTLPRLVTPQPSSPHPVTPQPSQPRRPVRNNQPPNRFGNFVYYWHFGISSYHIFIYKGRCNETLILIQFGHMMLAVIWLFSLTCFCLITLSSSFATLSWAHYTARCCCLLVGVESSS